MFKILIEWTQIYNIMRIKKEGSKNTSHMEDDNLENVMLLKNNTNKTVSAINSSRLRPAKAVALGIILSGLLWATAAYGIYTLLTR